MKVIVREDRRAPTVVHLVLYRAGSMDEVSGRTGVAHVLEHMMFKGTKTVPQSEFSRRVAALGGRENAFTSRDYTGYFQQLGSSHLAEVMSLEADRMSNLVLTAEEFDKEIKVVMEERRLRTEDRAQSLVYEQLMAAAWKAAPYRVPVIGWMNDLESMRVGDAAAWYRDWYTPSNAILVVAGDVSGEEVYRLAGRTYGRIDARALPARKSQLEPAQQVQHAPVGTAPLPHRAGTGHREVHGVGEALAPHGLDEQREGERLLHLHHEQVVPPDGRHVAVLHLAAHGPTLRRQVRRDGGREVALGDRHAGD